MTQNTFSMSELIPVISETIADGGVFPVTVNGNSMYPFLRNGQDTVYFASLKGHEIKKGDIVLYERKDGVFIMHRIYEINHNGTYCFVADNHTKFEQNITPDQLRAFVPYIIRDGKKVSCEKGIQHRMMTFYMLLHISCPKTAKLFIILNFGILKIKRMFNKK